MPRIKKATTKKKTEPKPVKKKTVKAAKEEIKKEPKEKARYFEAVGRRKTASARVRLFTQGEKSIIVNGKPHNVYFPYFVWQKKLEEPLEAISIQGKFGLSIKVKGGGLPAQAEACRHGIARALVLLNPYFKKRLKKSGFLTRDPRMRERKKFGLKGARKAPQWSKR